jgi:predicted secreted hydrolase
MTVLRHCRKGFGCLALALMLGACRPPPPPQDAAAPALQADRLSVLRGGAEGFAQVLEARRFEFPQDHGPHPEFRHEWWYFTGQLTGPAGHSVGFELTVFRLGLRPPPAGAVAASSLWQARQVYAAHFAISDVSRGRFFSATRYARDALDLAGAQAQPFALHVADWSVAAVPDSLPLHWQLQAADGPYQLRLDLRSDAAPVLNGEAGLSRKADAPVAASYYYSMPRLSARGEIGRAGVWEPLSGQVWLDREWGSGSLGAQQQGWDWFALDLDDGSSLMFYALRDAGGGRDPHSAGTYVDPAGGVRPLGNGDVRIDVQRYWESPRGGRYPAQWQLRIPALDLRLEVTPLLADQELDTAPRYWEGAVSARGEQRGTPLGARGYAELVGYAQAQASPITPSATAPPTH